MLQLKAQSDQITVEQQFRLKPTVFGATQHSPIFYKNHLFGIRPDGQLVCLDLDGNSVWQSGAATRFGNGPFMIAQDLLFAMDDSGQLRLAEASTSQYNELATAKVLEGPDAWGPMALADGRLVLRDLYKMICLDVAAK